MNEQMMLMCPTVVRYSQAEHTKEAGVLWLLSNAAIAHVLEQAALQAFHPPTQLVMLQLIVRDSTSNCIGSLIRGKLHIGSAAAQHLLRKTCSASSNIMRACRCRQRKPHARLPMHNQSMTIKQEVL